MESQYIGRFVVAAAFLTVWLARRKERSSLFIGCAHLGWAAVQAACVALTEGGGRSPLETVGPGLYVGFCWMATEQLRRGCSNLKGAWAGGATLVALLLIMLESSPGYVEAAATTASLLASGWFGFTCWQRGAIRHQVNAVMFGSQELLVTAASMPAFVAATGSQALTVSCVLALVMVAHELISSSSMPAVRVDEQTGLPNRRALVEELQVAASSLTPQSFLGVVVADIGGLGRMNSVLGQAETEKLLVITVTRLKGLCELGTTIARTGASEFTFLVQAPRTCGNGPMERLADRVVAAMRQPVGARGRDFFMRARVGIHAVEPNANDEDVLRLAGLASAQLESPDGWGYFDASLHDRLTRRIAIERGIREALINQEFTLVYQPIVCAQSRVLCKAEALIRWNSRELGEVSPAEFIPIAESTGQIVDIGRWVLARACVQCASWRRHYSAKIVVSVNVAAAQLQQVDFVDTLRETLECLTLPPDALELELTEGALPLDSTSVERTLAAVRSLGVRLALDDFGTGYSSLSRLARLEFDTLKIDRAFVRDIEDSERARRLCEFACTLGRQLDLQVVAEGVETEAQASLLSKFGVDRFQGYLFGRPVPAEVLALRYQWMEVSDTGGALVSVSATPQQELVRRCGGAAVRR